MFAFTCFPRAAVGAATVGAVEHEIDDDERETREDAGELSLGSGDNCDLTFITVGGLTIL